MDGIKLLLKQIVLALFGIALLLFGIMFANFQNDYLALLFSVAGLIVCLGALLKAYSDAVQ